MTKDKKKENPKRSSVVCQQSILPLHDDDNNKDPTIFEMTTSTTTIMSNETNANTIQDFLSQGGWLLVAPTCMTLVAFWTYTKTSSAFHSLVDIISGHTWAPVDGGTYLTDLITPAINGPVASFISLLFGTLTSMTVGNLYQRQTNLGKNLSEVLETIRLLRVHLAHVVIKSSMAPNNRNDTTNSSHNDEYYPLIKVNKLLGLYVKGLLQNLQENDNMPYNTHKDKVMKNRELGRLITEEIMATFHEMQVDPNLLDKLNTRAMDEAYQTLNRLIQARSQLISSYESTFPIWHYGNLTVLALAICFIFLVLTDKTALLFLGGFQLRMCWAMLIGTFTMCAVVIYDLLEPISGAFQIVRPLKIGGISLDDYVETIAEDVDPVKLLRNSTYG